MSQLKRQTGAFDYPKGRLKKMRRRFCSAKQTRPTLIKHPSSRRITRASYIKRKTRNAGQGSPHQTSPGFSARAQKRTPEGGRAPKTHINRVSNTTPQSSRQDGGAPRKRPLVLGEYITPLRSGVTSLLFGFSARRSLHAHTIMINVS